MDVRWLFLMVAFGNKPMAGWTPSVGAPIRVTREGCERSMGNEVLPGVLHAVASCDHDAQRRRRVWTNRVSPNFLMGSFSEDPGQRWRPVAHVHTYSVVEEKAVRGVLVVYKAINASAARTDRRRTRPREKRSQLPRTHPKSALQQKDRSYPDSNRGCSEVQMEDQNRT